MDLREFIKTTLVQIVEGVQDARAAVVSGDAGRNGAEVVPHSTSQNVGFDVAVTVTESSEIEGGGGAKLAVFAVGGKGTKSKESEAVSRVTFSIPLRLPHSPEPPPRPIENYDDEDNERI